MITAREFKIFLLVAFTLTAPVWAGLVTPWLLAFPVAVVVLATVGRVQTVRRRNRELK